MDKIALVISICAFLVSIVVPVFEFIWNQSLNRHNLEAEYFREIYGEILYQKIPGAIQFISYDGKEVSGTEKMIDVLREIRVKSLYFKVTDKNFFDTLKNTVQNLEDYIVKADDKMTTAQFTAFYDEIGKKTDQIYNLMGNKYIGKKS